MMVAITFKSEISQADLDAAFKFMQKRARRAEDGIEGMLTSMFAVMFLTGECLADCGAPISEVENVFEQAKNNVMFALRSQQTAHQLSQ